MQAKQRREEKRREEADALSLRGSKEVAKAWQRGDLYARLWLMLYHAGRIAPSPLEARERMQTSLADEEKASKNSSTSEHLRIEIHYIEI